MRDEPHVKIRIATHYILILMWFSIVRTCAVILSSKSWSWYPQSLWEHKWRHSLCLMAYQTRENGHAIYHLLLRCVLKQKQYTNDALIHALCTVNITRLVQYGRPVMTMPIPWSDCHSRMPWGSILVEGYDMKILYIPSSFNFLYFRASLIVFVTDSKNSSVLAIPVINMT